MSTIAIPNPADSGRYGATELKEFIHKYTRVGFGISVSIVALLLLLYFAYMKATEEAARLKAAPVKIQLVNAPPPPSEAAQAAPPPPPQAVQGPAARAGTPIPVPDAMIAPDLKDFANVNEIQVASTQGGDGTDIPEQLDVPTQLDVKAPVEEEDPYAFVAVEKEPYTDLGDLQKNAVYPDIAKRAGVEGRVTVRVLVGKDGKVKKHLVETSDSNLLDEAAVKAVLKAVFTPAVQNGQSVECWVSIPVVFKLR